MTTVYVVSHGSKYEGTGTEAVFASHAKAEAYVEHKITTASGYTGTSKGKLVERGHRDPHSLGASDYFKPKCLIHKEDLRDLRPNEAQQIWYYEGWTNCWTIEEFNVQK